MSNSDDFSAIRELCEDYYQQRITKDEYRTARTMLLEKIDREFNCSGEGANIDSAAGFLDKIMSVFKKNDEEKMT